MYLPATLRYLSDQRNGPSPSSRPRLDLSGPEARTHTICDRCFCGLLVRGSEWIDTDLPSSTLEVYFGRSYVHYGLA